MRPALFIIVYSLTPIIFSQGRPLLIVFLAVDTKHPAFHISNPTSISYQNIERDKVIIRIGLFVSPSLSIFGSQKAESTRIEIFAYFSTEYDEAPLNSSQLELDYLISSPITTWELRHQKCFLID